MATPVLQLVGALREQVREGLPVPLSAQVREGLPVRLQARTLDILFPRLLCEHPCVLSFSLLLDGVCGLLQ